MVEESNRISGKITPLAKNIVFRPCADLEENDPGVVSVICLGTAEQIRNIFALNYFTSMDIFGSIIVPSGSACATLVTYPSGNVSQCSSRKVVRRSDRSDRQPLFPTRLHGRGHSHQGRQKDVRAHREIVRCQATSSRLSRKAGRFGRNWVNLVPTCLGLDGLRDKDPVHCS